MGEDEERGSQPQGRHGGTGPRRRAFLTNMSAPMPIHRKIYLVLRNNLTKIRRGQSCCGHPGEPGC